MNDAPADDHDPSALPLDEARARIVASLRTVEGSERVATGEARGRVAAEDVLAPTDVPPFRSAAMDGYAFRHADANAPLRIADRSLAGHPSNDRLDPGTCHRVTTGARVADGADTVVQQENVALDVDRVRILERPASGLHVRDRGSDTARGERLIDADRRIGAAALALLAAHGMDAVRVRRRVRVALLSTGDELREPGATLARGQINDANRALLVALLDQPDIELVDLGIVADSRDALLEAVERAGRVDAFVSSGGVSVGDADHVRDVLGEDGAIELWKIAMKPGRPLAFGFIRPGVAWFGLPGNPVSAAITAKLVLGPALAKLSGHEWRAPLARRAILDVALKKAPGRMEFQRGVSRRLADGTLRVGSTGAQDSHVLRSLYVADCLIELPSASAGAAVGEEVSIHLLDEMAGPAL